MPRFAFTKTPVPRLLRLTLLVHVAGARSGCACCQRSRDAMLPAPLLLRFQPVLEVLCLLRGL
eukprot:7330940-Pyramimonas_sp.AAC.1